MGIGRHAPPLYIRFSSMGPLCFLNIDFYQFFAIKSNRIIVSLIQFHINADQGSTEGGFLPSAEAEAEGAKNHGLRPKT